MKRFRQAVETRDIDAMIATLHDDVVFRSPLIWKPIVGKATVGEYLRAALHVLEGFRYAAEMHGDGKSTLEFHATVGGKEVQGIDLCVAEGDELRELTVFVRPLSATLALGEAMKAQLARQHG